MPASTRVWNSARLSRLSSRCSASPARARRAVDARRYRISHGVSDGFTFRPNGESGRSIHPSPARRASGAAIGRAWLGTSSPALPHEHPSPQPPPRSITSTRAPAPASSSAAHAPTMPPPTTTTSAAAMSRAATPAQDRSSRPPGQPSGCRAPTCSVPLASRLVKRSRISCSPNLKVEGPSVVARGVRGAAHRADHVVGRHRARQRRS